MSDLADYLVPGEKVCVTRGELTGWKGTITRVIDETCLVQLVDGRTNQPVELPAWFIVTELELEGDVL